MACSSDEVNTSACGRQATAVFNAQEGEVFSVFAQAAPLQVSAATSCWPQPSISLNTSSK
jgi:hypothetical protein